MMVEQTGISVHGLDWHPASFSDWAEYAPNGEENTLPG